MKMPQRTLRWRREPGHKGLMGVGQVRGWELWLKNTCVASVGHQFEGYSRKVEGYGASAAANADLGIPHFNTYGEGVRSTPREAMADAERVLSMALSGKFRVKFKRPEGMEDA